MKSLLQWWIIKFFSLTSLNESNLFYGSFFPAFNAASRGSSWFLRPSLCTHTAHMYMNTWPLCFFISIPLVSNTAVLDGARFLPPQFTHTHMPPIRVSLQMKWWVPEQRLRSSHTHAHVPCRLLLLKKCFIRHF